MASSCPYYFRVNATSEGGILCRVSITEWTSVDLYCGSADSFARIASGMCGSSHLYLIDGMGCCSFQVSMYDLKKKLFVF